MTNLFQYNWDRVILQSIESSNHIRSSILTTEPDNAISPNLLDFPQCLDKVWTKSSRKRKGNETFINRKEFPQCTFTPIEEGGPTPVIFIVNGRSGSDATWATLSTLAGGASGIGEHTGENEVKAMDFLGRMTEAEGKWWVTEHLCQFAHHQCDKPLSAFKWKPFVDSWKLPAAQGMLKQIASFDQPRIKVIFMMRNPLDVLISKAKHKKSRQSHKLIMAHCEAKDEECIAKQKMMGTGLTLPTDYLLRNLEDSFAALQVFAGTLEEMNIEHVKTTYEDLYNRDDAEEWMKIFKYLGRGPSKDLTMVNVTDAFALAPTFQKNHNESLANYAEVRDLLTGSEFEELLH